MSVHLRTCLRVRTCRCTLRELELEDGDVLIVQRNLEVAMTEQARYPSAEAYLTYIHARRLVSDNSHSIISNMLLAVAFQIPLLHKSSKQDGSDWLQLDT